jgi:toxin ParE1/3/4
MTPEIHPAAQVELAAAADAGEQIATGLAEELLAETQRILGILCEFPGLGTRLDKQYRRFPLSKFPYAVVFRVSGERLQVVAFAHRRMRPTYWRRRVW